MSKKPLIILISILCVSIISLIIIILAPEQAIKETKGESFDLSFTEYGRTGHYNIFVDNRTGVCYLYYGCGYQAGLTPLLKSDGTPVLENELEEYKSGTLD